ncbi:MAG: NADH-quinone oxidoreductase subunit D [Conexivisphaerales archaeon]
MNLNEKVYDISEVGSIEPEGDREIVLQIGPAHPGSGHMRIKAWMDGDIITKVDADIGFVHRTSEWLSERRQFIKAIPIVERIMLPDTVHANLAYVLALEKILDVEPPPRAQYLRSLAAEINRITSHLYGIGLFGIFLGSSTVYMWAFGDREPFIDLMEMLTGARITNSYIVPGGVRWEMPKGFKEKAESTLQYMENRFNDYNDMWVKNPVVEARTVNVGVVDRNRAIKLGVVGPNLRASGVDYDTRKASPYAAYKDIDFEVPRMDHGDTYDRLLIRIEEIKQSIRIIRQILKDIPEGKIIADSIYSQLNPVMKKVFEQQQRVMFPAFFNQMRPASAESIARVEAGRGEIFFYLRTSGDKYPYRFRWVTPSFRNLAYFTDVAVGYKLADLPAIYGSIDYFPPEADR